MKLGEITEVLENFAPLSFQETYDNSGLLFGRPDQEINSAIVCVDITEEVVAEAIDKNSNLIISHHPLVFSGLKSLTGKNYVERILLQAIHANIALYSMHTNLDSMFGGVSARMAQKIGLNNIQILQKKGNSLRKLVTFIPTKNVDEVREAIFSAGAGHIGNYDSCSYNTNGQGTFRAGKDANPYVGKPSQLHFEDEVRFETIYPKHIERRVLNALQAAHPYEEVAYDIYPLENNMDLVGFGMVGNLSEAMEEKDFLAFLKTTFDCEAIRHTKLLGRKVRKVALCGGSGSSLLKQAMNTKADFFVTGDFKYHQFFDAENKIVIADIGHYESEQFTKEIIYEILMKNFSTFAVHLSEINTNPINYF